MPHVGCLSHKLHRDINDMIARDSCLGTILESVHRTMKDCKTKIGNRAALENITALAPIISNSTT